MKPFRILTNCLPVRLRISGIICGIMILCLNVLLSRPATGTSPEAVILEIKGAIGPAISEYVQKGIKTAVERDARVVVLKMDTPGGLDNAMRDIIQAILNSPLPVITYVSPEGARAASAGTYILYASHIAAMAPATNLGAATPVQIISVPKGGKEESSKESETEKEVAEGDAMQRKIIHDAAAYIRSLADRHGRNSEWAEQAVRQAKSLTAHEAFQKNVIDIVAKDIHDLLQQADGREVRLRSGRQVLATHKLNLITIQPTWQNRLLGVISDPNVAYLLLLFGVYGLIFELANPGVFFPGIAGVISLLLALYSFQVLPINYTGLALIVLGIGLLTGEAFLPSFGSIGIGGIIAFAAGSLILFDNEQLRVSRALITGTTFVFAGCIIWLMSRLVHFRKKSSITGSEALSGGTGEVAEDFCNEGRIWLYGESWQATCNGCLKKGDRVRVTGYAGLVLTVEKLEEDT